MSRTIADEQAPCQPDAPLLPLKSVPLVDDDPGIFALPAFAPTRAGRAVEIARDGERAGAAVRRRRELVRPTSALVDC